ncbi:MAG: 30S ribosomal protein S3 [Patescibacteria group bacterium]
MGHKVHPKVFRLATIGTWDSKWFAKKAYKSFLKQDVQIRAYLKKKLREAAVDRIVIDRSRQSVTITIFTAKPGFIIGRAGAGIDDLKAELKRTFFRGQRSVIQVNVQDIGHGSLSAPIVAEQVAMELERRMPFRRVMKQTIDRVMKSGAGGIRIIASGRLNGADIARTERISHGKIPLQNLRANIQYAQAQANTLFGVIGVKVWIYLGEVFTDKIPDVQPVTSAPRAPQSDRRPSSSGGRRPHAPRTR